MSSNSQQPPGDAPAQGAAVVAPRLLVLGMHRSGTSLLCGLLEQAGVFFGHAEDLIAPSEENPKGFYEHKLLRWINDGLLQSGGCDWAEISDFRRSMPQPGADALGELEAQARALVATLESQAAGRPIGIKDPRLCLLAPYWETVLGRQAFVVFVHRHPDEISLSLQKRNAMPAEVADYLTEQYTHAALSYLSGRPHLITGFADLISDPVREIGRVHQALEQHGLGRLEVDAVRLAGVPDPGLYRSKTERHPERETRLIHHWHRALEHGGMPYLPAAPAAASPAVIAFEHEYRFARWLDLDQRFRTLEARYIALTRPAEALGWFEGGKGEGTTWRQAEGQAQSQQLDADFLREVLAFLMYVRERPDQARAQAALRESSKSVLAAGQQLERLITGLQATAAETVQLKAVVEDRMRLERELAEKTAVLQAASEALDQARQDLERNKVLLKTAASRAAKLETELASSGDTLDALRKQHSSLALALSSAKQDLEASRQLGAELRTREDFATRNALGHYAGRQAAVKQLARHQQTLASLSQAVRDVLHSMQAIRDSTSWKIAEKQMRLMMRPASLGRGDTGLDVLFKQLSVLDRLIVPDPEAKGLPVFHLHRSPMATQGSYRTSIIVLNRDGAQHLEHLFSSFLAHHEARSAEWVIVDHASEDTSHEVIHRYMEKLPISVIEFGQNHSFSFSNNFAVQYARGHYLVFCNNDIIFDQPVLNDLLSELTRPETGICGARLYYPDPQGARSARLQHAGIHFEYDEQFAFPRPVNVKALEEAIFSPTPVPAVTAALMACRTSDFIAAGGFNEGYNYGYEDIDLALTFSSKLGRSVVLSARAAAIHDESASQRKQDPGELARRRRGNIELFRSRYADHVMDRYMQREAGSKPRGRAFRLGLVVTDDRPDTTAGDFFTASELAEAVETELGWTCSFLAQRNATRDWYDCAGLDCVLVLIDGYDLARIRNASDSLLRVAWLRNWFDRWVARPWFNTYDLALCSSETAARYVATHSAVGTGNLRIATNPARFNAATAKKSEFRSDYCFTGSYWNAPREIEGLDPARLPYEFALYGAGWEKHEQFRSSYRGAVPYASVRHVYASSKILIDDANHVTKPWGSVNSRVFDALAAGTLVISNGAQGAQETFRGLLPTWNSIAELEQRIRHFMEHPQEREALCRKLQELVLEHHTYAHRARELATLLDAFRRRRRVAIKLPVPRWEVANEWGDFHFGAALSRSLAKLGYRVRLDVLSEWHEPRCADDEVVIVLRGLSAYEPKPGQINLMWNISHPDKVADAEYEKYDHVFIASLTHAATLAARLRVPVTALLQCTDADRFHWFEDVGRNDEVVFVGNSRKVQRPIVRQAIVAGLNPQVYGTNWNGLIDERYIKGEHIENDRLGRFYAEAGVVLNDHWDTMRQLGFISNRLFDAAACGGRVVTDPVVGVPEVFGDLVHQCAEDFHDLPELVSSVLAEGPDKLEPRRNLATRIGTQHSFDSRAQQLHAIIGALSERAGASAVVAVNQ